MWKKERRKKITPRGRFAPLKLLLYNKRNNTMQPIRIKACSESDLRMLGDLARNIQRVLPVTQADIDAAAAQGIFWTVEPVIEVSDPLDNLRGGTQLVIKQNSVQPGQNVRRVMIVSGNSVVVGPDYSPLSLPGAVADSLEYVKAYGLAEQFVEPTPDSPTGILCNNGGIGIDSQGNIIVSGNHETIKDSKNNTVTCDMLLGIAGIRDEQEILSGTKIRRIGIKVLDGTEDWVEKTTAQATWYEADILDNCLFSHLLCTHFTNYAMVLQNNTVYKSAGSSVLCVRYDDAGSLANFKQWLATQYSNGTPVILIYALETPITEQVSPQTMQVKAGDNSITIVDASLSDLLLEAKYTKSI